VACFYICGSFLQLHWVTYSYKRILAVTGTVLCGICSLRQVIGSGSEKEIAGFGGVSATVIGVFQVRGLDLQDVAWR
jgi:hypothetical protein